MDGREKSRASKRSGESCTRGRILWAPEIQQPVDPGTGEALGQLSGCLTAGLLPLASPVTATFAPATAGGRS